jgi:hypothetical protein
VCVCVCVCIHTYTYLMQASGGAEVSAAGIEALTGMGFTREQATMALKRCSLNARLLMFSLIPTGLMFWALSTLPVLNSAACGLAHLRRMQRVPI